MSGSHVRYLLGALAGAVALPIALWSMTAAFQGIGYDPARWVGESLAHKAAVARAEPKPQILILGGSGALFAYSATFIRDEFGIPASNVAVHAGLGRAYMLRHGAGLIKKGDLVVVPLEYELYGPRWHDAAERYQALVYDRPYFLSLPVHEQLVVIGNISPAEWIGLARAWLRPDPTNPREYQASTLNAHGDETNNTRTPVPPPPHLGNRYVMDRRAAHDLRAFASAVRSQGADVVLVFPSLHVDEFRRQVEPQFLNAIRATAAAAGIRLLGDPHASAFPTRYRFDTRHHQTRQGQVESTRRLIADLRAAGIALPGSH